ncbi:hypothetical protein [Hydrogenophaga sp.]|uniref:hypothetical protein n=1 Tax=Hydrogenophaga sp. TaxID=1904254 RepID=UPI0035B2EA6D
MLARLRTLALVLGLTTMALPNGIAQAQTTVTTTTTSTIARAGHADVEALMALEDWPGKLAGLRETFAGQMRLAVNSPRWRDLSPQARDELGRQLAEVMARHFAWPGPLQSLVQETYLTQVAAEDVATLLAFYRSADGQWLVKRLQPALDQVEYALQQQGRQDLDRLTHTWLASEAPAVASATTPPAPWQATTSHEAAAQRLLAATSVRQLNGQLFEMRLRAIERFQDAAQPLPDRPARFQGFTTQMRETVSLDAYMPSMVAQLTQQLNEDELTRALSVETSDQRQQVKAVDQRIGQVYGQRMQAWQRDVLFPALRQVMEAARRDMPR